MGKVIIPETNVRNLMLKEEVIDAVKKGVFNIWAVSTIDEGIEILTGKKSGKRSASGSFPKGTINRLVEDKLKKYTKNQAKLKSFASKDQD